MNISFSPDGQMITNYDNIYEMYYNLFLEIGLFVNQDGYLQDSDTGVVIRYKDKYIKASLNDTPIYAGRTDILFDPAHNFDLMRVLMGYYIDKRDAGEEPIGYISQGIYDNKEEQVHSVFIKSHTGLYESALYKNSYLGFIDCIFRMGGTIPNLYPYDIVEEEMQNGTK